MQSTRLAAAHTKPPIWHVDCGLSVGYVVGPDCLSLLSFSATGAAVQSIAKLAQYLAAYAAGITLASLAPEHAEAMRPIGDTIAEALKLAAVLAFACLLRPDQFRELGWTGAAFVAVALLVVRPLATAFALLNRSLTPREWLAAAWFGPKGFASIVYGTLMIQHAIPHAHAMFDLIAVVTAVSIVAHSSTDLWVVRTFPASGSEARATSDA
jgi:NhaP-type Na+/H+ or K+/H+ antiporter